MTDSFWVGGADAYESGLREHYGAVLSDLRSRLSVCTDGDQCSEFEVEIIRTETEFKSKLQEIGKLLF